jgi:hypothetical protein
LLAGWNEWLGWVFRLKLHLVLEMLLLGLLLTHCLLHHLELLLWWHHQVTQLGVERRSLQKVSDGEEVLDLNKVFIIVTVLFRLYL